MAVPKFGLGAVNRAIALRFRTSESFYRNSYLYIITSAVTAGAGFVFWLIAAHTTEVEAVGSATAVISLVYLGTVLTRFGLDQSLVRFFPEADRKDVYSTSVVVTSLSSVALGIIIVLVIPHISPELEIIRDYWWLFLATLAADSLNFMTGRAFVAMRMTNLYLFQNVLFGVRIVLLVPFQFLGTAGILLSFSLALGVSSAFSIEALRRVGVGLGTPSLRFLRSSYRFSLGNYAAGVLLSAPIQIIPLISITVLGAEETSKYFIAYTISAILMVIPGAFSTGVLVEGSHGVELMNLLRKSMNSTMAIMIPLAVAMILLGKSILMLFGQDYAEACSLYVILVLSRIPSGACWNYFSVYRVRKCNGRLMAFSALVFIIAVSLAYSMPMSFGIDGLGYAWLASYTVVSVLMMVDMARSKAR